MNYEAFDEIKEEVIYSGSRQSDLIYELLDYIVYQNHIDEDSITEEEIRSLNHEALRKVGIKLFINR